MRIYPEARDQKSPRKTRRFVLSKEFRPPKRDEWYLSGAIAEAYRAPSNLSTSFWIVRPVKQQ